MPELSSRGNKAKKIASLLGLEPGRVLRLLEVGAGAGGIAHLPRAVAQFPGGAFAVLRALFPTLIYVLRPPPAMVLDVAGEG